MHANQDTSTVLDGDCRRLAALLDTEESHYRRLLRLAWRQNSYMKRQDVDRLEVNADEWARRLPEADTCRIARERLVAELGHRVGITVPPGRVSDLLDYVAPATRREVGAAVGRLRATAQRLARQNELNRTLAAFNLDLAREETEIFRRVVLEDPSGRYGDDARTTARGAGGILVKQA
ncbi:flagellar export chaperone FlgN [bacterium]|nr:flagellar export chaperone FlgN [bacterium]